MANNKTIAEQLKEMSQFEQEVKAEKDLLVEKAFKSQNPADIVFANKLLKERAMQGQKSYVIDPLSDSTFNGFRTRNFETGFGALRSMAKNTPLISAILATRKEQVASYNSYSNNPIRPGWRIEKNVEDYFNDSEEYKQHSSLTIADKQEIRKIISFVENCGITQRSFYGDDFDSFLRKFVEDSLTLDQACFEVIPSKIYKPYEFCMVDGATIRFAADSTIEQMGKERGYYPNAVQLYQGTTIHSVYYPWEMAVGIRNPSTNIAYNGYGISELELLVKVVTWMLYAEAYNGKFFSQGSNPKGFFMAKGNLSEDKIAEFKQAWQAQVSGLNGAFKIPILSGGDISFVDCQKSNSDMEFDKWLEYLTRLTCAIYKIDPKELGFSLNSSDTVSYESSIQEKLTYSKEKGLIPLLKFIEKQINRYVIYPLCDKRYRFRFCGVDNSDSMIEASDLQKVEKGALSWKEYRNKYNLPTQIEQDDFLLNTTWVQIKQMENQQQQVNAQQQGGGDDFQNVIEQQKNLRANQIENPKENIFKDLTEENPFVRDLQSFTEKAFNYE